MSCPKRENLSRLLRALQDIEARMLPLDIPEHAEELSVDWLAEGGNFSFETRYGRLDVMQLVADLSYEDLAPNALEVQLEGMTVRVCSYRHLVGMKEAAGRGEDQIDLKRLREARGEEA